MSAEIEHRLELLESELWRLVEFSVEEPNADPLILFGSMDGNRSSVHEWTDLALVIVAMTELPFQHRALAVLKGARPGVGVAIFVHTHFEWERMKVERRFIVEDVLKRGRIVYERDG